VQVDPSLNATDVFVNLGGIALVGTTRLDLTNYQAVTSIPAAFAGPLTLDPVAKDATGTEIPGASITVSVKLAVSPVQVQLAENYYFIDPSSNPQQLALTGTYADTTTRDLTSSITGTTYVSSNTAVVQVSADGLATIAGPGIAAITATNGSASDYATFLIENASVPLAPLDVSSQFSIQQSGYRLDRTTGFFVQTVTVTNSSNVPLPASVFLILSGLTPGVTLVNRSGTTQTISPSSPYMSLPASSDGRTLAPGQTTTFTLQFLNPNRLPISYSASVYRSSTAP